MHRRDFVKSLSFGLVGTTFFNVGSARDAQKKWPQAQQFEIKKTDSLLAQSGVFGRELFVIGVLRCGNPTAVNQRIQAARQKSNYRCVLTHRSRNKYKIAYFDYLLADWLEHDDLSIQLRVLRSHNLQQNRTTGTGWMRSYVDELNSSLISGGGMPVEGGRILTQPRFKAKQQNELEKMLNTRNDRIESIEKVMPKNSELMQFLVTLTGIVRASEDTSSFVKARNATKEKTIAMVKESLKAQDFKQPHRTKHFELTVI